MTRKRGARDWTDDEHAAWTLALLRAVEQEYGAAFDDWFAALAPAATVSWCVMEHELIGRTSMPGFGPLIADAVASVLMGDHDELLHVHVLDAGKAWYTWAPIDPHHDLQFDLRARLVAALSTPAAFDRMLSLLTTCLADIPVSLAWQTIKEDALQPELPPADDYGNTNENLRDARFLLLHQLGSDDARRKEAFFMILHGRAQDWFWLDNHGAFDFDPSSLQSFDLVESLAARLPEPFLAWCRAQRAAIVAQWPDEVNAADEPSRV